VIEQVSLEEGGLDFDGLFVGVEVPAVVAAGETGELSVGSGAGQAIRTGASPAPCQADIDTRLP
jgi:hypothetical protein